jgi:hypothetical protein
MKKLTKIQEADALLWAARHWQNHQLRPGRATTARSYFTDNFWQDDVLGGYGAVSIASASSALSEVAGMGIDFE